MDAAVRITVLRRTLTEGLVGRYTDHPWQLCERLAEGQEFVSTGANMPAGFCSWAWADIQKYVLVLARGGDLIGPRPGCFVTSCTDGFRPVIFGLERATPESSQKSDALMDSSPTDCYHPPRGRPETGLAASTA